MDWDGHWWNVLGLLAGIWVLLSVYSGATMVAPPGGGWAVYLAGAGLAIFSGGAVEDADPAYGWGSAISGGVLVATPFLFGLTGDVPTAAAIAVPGLVGVLAGGKTALG